MVTGFLVLNILQLVFFTGIKSKREDVDKVGSKTKQETECETEVLYAMKH